MISGIYEEAIDDEIIGANPARGLLKKQLTILVGPSYAFVIKMIVLRFFSPPTPFGRSSAQRTQRVFIFHFVDPPKTQADIHHGRTAAGLIWIRFFWAQMFLLIFESYSGRL